ncbi:hypothetical protein K9N68_31975 [Kovacikia minuta CCNUW1]|uniref:hypothetical protein n=1 Tax=Kovacikia minuta TaxID=2931930 RepID=UPI001CCA7B61|nr:hypothetical protein [Kovacikia minuta]UBF26098.1 hypothetical protein K9N68_31975 [Kovacikia minuta CCNUW1]
MNRLLIAFLILLAVLLGLRFISSPFFQQNIWNRIGASSQTQTTGFNSNVPTDISANNPSNPRPSPGTPIQPNNPPTTPSQPSNPENSNNNGGNASNKPAVPTPPRRPIPGSW